MATSIGDGLFRCYHFRPEPTEPSDVGRKRSALRDQGCFTPTPSSSTVHFPESPAISIFTVTCLGESK